MPTYTGNKKINKPNYGEYPNAWDAPINSDWDIVDAALGSAVSITLSSSNVDLTIEQAQNQRIVLQGTPGATRVITIPFKYLSTTEAVGGMWIIDNQTAYNQTIGTQVAGGDAVSVTTGRKAIVYCDGTSIKFADDARLIQGNNIKVTGSTIGIDPPVTVENGGTGRITLTSGSVLVGNGTGNVTLVAPGTTGNVLTSNGTTWTSAAPTGGGGTGGITSINFSTAANMGLSLLPSSVTTSGQTVNLSGTLAVANGGTGATSISSGIVKSNGTILTGNNKVDLTSEVQNALGISNGGTGTNTILSGIVKSSGTALSGGNTVNLASGSTDITGTLALANGGTGTTLANTIGFIKGPGVGGTGLGVAASVNLATEVGLSILPVANGGTNISTPTANGAVYVNSTGNGYLTGQLPLASGGTGASDTTAASGTGKNVLSASPTFTGTANFAAISATGTISTSGSATLTSSTSTLRINTASALSGAEMVSVVAPASTDGVVSKVTTAGNFAYVGQDNTGAQNFTVSDAGYIRNTGGINSGPNTGITGAYNKFSSPSDWAAEFYTPTNSVVFVRSDVAPANIATLIGFYGAGNAYLGGILNSGATIGFVQPSDYRLKENINQFTNGLSVINKLSPVTYTFKNDTSNKNMVGFIAHELQQYVPNAVFGEKDAVDEDGKIKPQGVDWSFLIPYLVSSIKELTARVEALEAKIGPS